MSCENVQELISPYLDRRISDEDREKLLAHAGSCRECGASLDSHQKIRYALRQMQPPRAPASLTARLRVAASHDRERRLATVSLRSRLAYWSSRAQLFFDNLVRPGAVPVAGGMLSAITIFSILLPILTFEHVYADQMLLTDPEGAVVVLSETGDYQAPSRWEYAPRIMPAYAKVPEVANVVELTIDQRGNVADWVVSQGELTPDITNIIMLSKFSPATNLGLPVSGKVKAVQIRSVHTAPIRVRS